MEQQYTGTIIEESLEDKKILDSINVINTKVSDEENLEERWHMHKVNVTEREILNLAQHCLG